LNIFFDMDYTLIGLTGTLRPLVIETFEQLIDDGHTLYIWSGLGNRSSEVEKLGLSEYIAGVSSKPIDDFEELVKKKFNEGEIDVYPDFVVDDHEEIVSALGGGLIKAFFAGDNYDREMEHMYNIISIYDETGSSDDHAFRPRPLGLYKD